MDLAWRLKWSTLFRLYLSAVLLKALKPTEWLAGLSNQNLFFNSVLLAGSEQRSNALPSAVACSVSEYLFVLNQDHRAFKYHHYLHYCPNLVNSLCPHLMLF